RPLDALEDALEHAVVGVEVRLALHQAGAAQVVEAQQARAVQPLLERRQEGLPFLDGDGDALVAQPVEEVEEHLPTGCSAAPGRPTSWGSDRSSGRSAGARRRPAPS